MGEEEGKDGDAGSKAAEEPQEEGTREDADELVAQLDGVDEEDAPDDKKSGSD